MVMNNTIKAYHLELPAEYHELSMELHDRIHASLPEAESKVWHAHPVWFLDGNPIVGYHLLKSGIRLLFWSGQSFDEPLLNSEGKFKAAEYRFTKGEDISNLPLERWLDKSRDIQWDYKNIVKRKGELIRLK
jgi:hypothetical protein